MHEIRDLTERKEAGESAGLWMGMIVMCFHQEWKLWYDQNQLKRREDVVEKKEGNMKGLDRQFGLGLRNQLSKAWILHLWWVPWW